MFWFQSGEGRVDDWNLVKISSVNVFVVVSMHWFDIWEFHKSFKFNIIGEFKEIFSLCKVSTSIYVKLINKYQLRWLCFLFCLAYVIWLYILNLTVLLFRILKQKDEEHAKLRIVNENVKFNADRQRSNKFIFRRQKQKSRKN